MAALDRVPELVDRIRGGTREERFLGATDLPNFMRKPYGAGWALVGDAGCHKDPFMALGICDALRDAELLADAVDAGLSGKVPMEIALAEYERQRDESTEADYHQNVRQAQFLPPPGDLLQIRGALRGNPAAATLFSKAIEGLLPREHFFNPENLAALTRAPARVSPDEAVQA
jgi:flavin-dependent dehydrogenase